MAATSPALLSSFFSTNHSQNPNLKITKRVSFKIQAAKLPPGRELSKVFVDVTCIVYVELPKEVPKLSRPVLGSEIWNSRACMIGLMGTFIVELIFNKGILEMIGVDIGKGL